MTATVKTEIPGPRVAEAGWPAGLGIIYLGISPWQGMWRNRHQLMSRFARQMPVLYVEPWQRLRRLRSSRPSLRGAWRELRTPTVDAREPGPCVFRSPAFLPVSGSRPLRRPTLAAWSLAVRRAARRAGIHHPVLWVAHPEMRDVVGKMGEVLSIYHVVDAYAGYTGVGGRGVFDAWENELLDAVDLTIAVSPELVADRRRDDRRVLLVENAVDYEAFARATREREAPADLARIPRPRYGYSGLIGARLDLQLLIDMARGSDDVSIVLLGKVDDKNCQREIAVLRSLENVYFLGEKPVSEVPRYVAGLDLGMLPYAINLETTNISPLKMYEYLAVGIPVLATPIPAARRHSALLALEESAEGFLKAGRRMLADDTPSERQARLALAASSTWDHRVQQIAAELRDLIRAKSASLVPPHWTSERA